MDNEYEIALTEDPEQSAREAIDRALDSFNRQYAGESHYQRVCFCLYDGDQEIVGGVTGEIFWGWLFVELLWIREDLRGHGYGHRLLVSIEREARKRGAKAAYLDTFSFHAPDFYKQHGYRVFGELQDFSPGHQRIYFTKGL